jgi:predicted 3-demethylubiquinone-9 3-methyltransferase (glyoxalase superfamily)
MKPKNTICLWFDKDALGAACFYAVTFPDSKVIAVHNAPADYPSGKKGCRGHCPLPFDSTLLLFTNTFRAC